MHLVGEKLALTLARTFRIAHGDSDHRDNILLRLSHGGEVGLGEVAVVPYYDHDLAPAFAFIERLGKLLWEHDPFDFQTLAETCRLADPQNRFYHVRAGVETACYDLVGKFMGLPLWRLFGLDANSLPRSSFTLPIAPPAEAVAMAREAAAFPILKIKVSSLDHLASLRAIREALPETTLRVDANTALTLPEALEMAAELARIGGVDLFEEPVRMGDHEALATLTRESEIPIFADESVQQPSDVARLAGKVDGVNLKLAKLGGLSQTRAAIAVARATGLKVMLGCMVESSIAVTAFSHLAPLADFADLDGPLLVSNDPFVGVSNQAGVLGLPEGPGLGVVEH